MSKITGVGGKAVEGHFEVFDEFGNLVDIWEYLGVVEICIIHI